jgi:hypothetical protein
MVGSLRLIIIVCTITDVQQSTDKYKYHLYREKYDLHEES